MSGEPIPAAGNFEFDAQAPTTPEALPAEQIALREQLLWSFDIAYWNYVSMEEASNGQRAEAADRLAVVDQGAIREEVEAVLAIKAVLAELQAEIDHFTKNPEEDSPEPGFDILIVPEGIRGGDKLLPLAVQSRLNTVTGRKLSPFIRSGKYDDARPASWDGRGYRLAFAPGHYNVPKGAAEDNKRWMVLRNESARATELRTADDAAALTRIYNLAQGRIPAGVVNVAERLHLSYFRRFDQEPVGGQISTIFVAENGEVFLDRSSVYSEFPSRALVVPKAHF